MAKLNVQKVRRALENSGGIITTIADRCGVTWNAVDNFLKKHPELEELKRCEDESINDLAETKLIDAIRKGQPWAIKYRLSTKAKHRGYYEKILRDVRVDYDEPNDADEIISRAVAEMKESVLIDVVTRAKRQIDARYKPE